MRIAMMGLALLMLVTIFQNCGSSSNDPGFFVQSNLDASGYAYEDCIADFCLAPEEMLWIKIKESNPYTVNLFYNNQGHFTVGGTCGIGPYFRHTVRWELRLAAGAQNIIGQGSSDNICINGKFSLAITTPGGLTDKTRYELNIELLGLGNGNIPISNPLPNNESSTDVITINQQIVDPTPNP